MKNDQYELISENKDNNNFQYREDCFNFNSKGSIKGIKKYINILSKHPVKLSLITMTLIFTAFLLNDFSLINLISDIAYTSGIGFGVQALLRLNEYAESNGKASSSVPITTIIISTLFLALPSLLFTDLGCSGVFSPRSVNKPLQNYNIDQKRPIVLISNTTHTI